MTSPFCEEMCVRVWLTCSDPFLPIRLGLRQTLALKKACNMRKPCWRYMGSYYEGVSRGNLQSSYMKLLKTHTVRINRICESQVQGFRVHSLHLLLVSDANFQCLGFKIGGSLSKLRQAFKLITLSRELSQSTTLHIRILTQ